MLESPALAQYRVHIAHIEEAGDTTLWQILGRSLATDADRPDSEDGCSREWVRARVGALTEPTLIVLEHYHHLSSVEHDRALLELVRTGPRLHVCVLARSVHLLDGPLHTHQVRVLTRADLAFTGDECREILAHSGGEHAPGRISAVTQAAGWPVVVAAILRSPATPEDSAPQSALRRFAIDILEVATHLDPRSRDVLLGAALVESFSLDQAALFSGASKASAHTHVHTLLQLGALEDGASSDGQGYRLHPAMRGTMSAIVTREFSSSRRESLALGIAKELETSDPLGALRIYLQFSSLAEAESVLWANFTAITDQHDTCLAALSPLTDAELSAHPTLAAARFFLELELPTVAPKRLWHTSKLFHTGAVRRLESNPEPTDPLHVGHRMLVMIGERMWGDSPAALAIARDIEAQLASRAGLTASGRHDAGRRDPGEQPVLLQELAFTAFIGGDSALARRVWQRLDSLMEPKPGAIGPGQTGDISRATLRHGPWQHAALSGLSLVESNEGNFRLGAELLAQADAVRTRFGAAPALAWVNAEVIRAHHAYEFARPEMLREAIARLSPWYDRIEQWPMVIMAETESVRYQRGVDWSIPHLRTGIAQIERKRHGVGVWGGYLALYQTMLATISGNLVTSKQIADALPAKNPYVQIERARRSLFQGNDVQALLMVQRLGPAVLNLRQQIDTLLIAAIAAWGCDRREEAFVALHSAAELIERCELSMMLRSVPFEPLAEIAAAARDAGFCDVSALIDAVPGPARCIRRESLTLMEQKSLESMLTHPPLADAAADLGIATATMKRHRLAVYRKLRVGSREEAILQATRMGLLSN
ncbi:helix-turn-helix transcriptional regulator [Microbacterium sp. Root61]|uniref:helix-turn-helix transcriptional regulator n=1 Tax=Microbacterium sp. Root61 TaxID=1736570 RepID=UPI00138EEB9C|nr:hypothetical protein [Microbacterium sp. Root61]